MLINKSQWDVIKASPFVMDAPLLLFYKRDCHFFCCFSLVYIPKSKKKTKEDLRFIFFIYLDGKICSLSHALQDHSFVCAQSYKHRKCNFTFPCRVDGINMWVIFMCDDDDDDDASVWTSSFADNRQLRINLHIIMVANSGQQWNEVLFPARPRCEIFEWKSQAIITFGGGVRVLLSSLSLQLVHITQFSAMVAGWHVMSVVHRPLTFTEFLRFKQPISKPIHTQSIYAH
jgi:hypothetical protein